MPDPDGILLVDKPAGPTSHDIVDVVRRRLGMRRVGHAGTLDPDATGLLIMLIGKGTSLFVRFSQYDKIYDVVLTLGKTTSTADAGGTVIAVADVPRIHSRELESVLGRFRGNISQVPPMVSAKKINGRKLYELARQGVEVERPAQQITIHDLSVRELNLPQIHMTVRCSKGTYVRTLCEDIGNALGCGGHMSRLRRLAIGPYRVEDAIGLSAMRSLSREELTGKLLGGVMGTRDDG